jgi:hypothetical protein
MNRSPNQNLSRCAAFFYLCSTMKTRFSHAAVFGLATSMAAIAFSLLLYLVASPMSPLHYLSYVIAIVIACIGVKKWREQSGGYLTFGQTYVHLLIQALIYSLIMAVWAYVFFGIIAPGAIEDMLLQMEVQWEEQGMPQSQIDAGLEMTRAWMSPLSMMIWSLIMNTLIFAVVHLIVAAIMKKDPPPASFQPPAAPYTNYPPQA